MKCYNVQNVDEELDIIENDNKEVVVNEFVDEELKINEPEEDAESNKENVNDLD